MAKVAVKLTNAQAVTILSPGQLWVDVKRGTETTAHAARCYVRNLRHDQCLIKLDFINAFHSIHEMSYIHTSRCHVKSFEIHFHMLTLREVIIVSLMNSFHPKKESIRVI